MGVEAWDRYGGLGTRLYQHTGALYSLLVSSQHSTQGAQRHVISYCL